MCCFTSSITPWLRSKHCTASRSSGVCQRNCKLLLRGWPGIQLVFFIIPVCSFSECEFTRCVMIFRFPEDVYNYYYSIKYILYKYIIIIIIIYIYTIIISIINKYKTKKKIDYNCSVKLL